MDSVGWHVGEGESVHLPLSRAWVLRGLSETLLNRQTWRCTQPRFPLRKPLAQVGKRPKWISPSFQDRKCSPEIICHFLLQRLSARGWCCFCRNGTAYFLPSTQAHPKPAPFSTPEIYQKTLAQGPNLWLLRLAGSCLLLLSTKGRRSSSTSSSTGVILEQIMLLSKKRGLSPWEPSQWSLSRTSPPALF